MFLPMVLRAELDNYKKLFNKHNDVARIVFTNIFVSELASGTKPYDNINDVAWMGLNSNTSSKASLWH